MAFPWKRLCVAVDFSEPSRAALELGAQLSRQLEAALTLVYVQELVVLPAGPMLPPTIYERIEADGKRLMADWLTEAQKLGGLALHGEVLSGTPFDGIVRYADERGADLIVIGTHGRTALRHVLLGSVAEKVVRHARCPVLTVRSAAVER